MYFSKAIKRIDLHKLVGDDKMDIVNKVIEITEEARILTGLNHLHILKYVDSFRDGNFYCIVTEHCKVCNISSF